MFKIIFQKFQFFGVMNLKNCVYISWKIQILTKLQHKITQIFTKKYYLPSKFSKLHNLEAHFCELLRPRAPPFQKIKWNPWNLVTTLQKSCFLGPTIFEIPQPNWYYSVRPKPGFGIGNRNQDQVSVSVSGPELFLPKPKLSPILKSTKNLVQLWTER